MDQQPKIAKQKSKEYPAVTLERAIEFVQKLKDYPISKPISYDIAAKAMQISTTTKSFTSTLSAAKQFGLIATSTGQAFSFTELAKRFLFPTEDLSSVKLQCFSSPKLYQALIKEYENKALPPQSTLENVLVAHYSIAPNAKSLAAKTFLDTAFEVGAVQSGILSLTLANNTSSTEPECNGAAIIDDETSRRASFEMSEADAKDLLTYEKLVVPFGQQKQAMLYVPNDLSTEDAEYLRDMISLMFKRLYKISN